MGGFGGVEDGVGVGVGVGVRGSGSRGQEILY